jgi:hypothetical protein
MYHRKYTRNERDTSQIGTTLRIKEKGWILGKVEQWVGDGWNWVRNMSQ